MRHKLFFLIFILLIISSIGFAQTTATWALTSNGNSSVAGSCSAAALVKGSGVGTLSYGSDGVYCSGWDSGSQNSNDYYQYTMTTTANLKITSVTFYTMRSGSSGTARAYYSINGAAEVALGSSFSVPQTTPAQTSYTGLSLSVASGQTFRVRVYAWNLQNSGRNFYNKNMIITGVVPPAISSPTSASVTINSAVLGGNITNVNGSNATERGIYYSTTDGFADGTGTKVSTTGSYGAGVFTVSVGSLSSNTPYYFKAFATNAGGTSYTAQATFTTLPNTYTVDITSTPPAEILVGGVDSGYNTPHQFVMTAGTSATYTVSLAGYTFAPDNLVVTNIAANTSQDFTGTLIPVPDIPASGNADIGGGPAAGGVNVATTVDLYNGPAILPNDPALLLLTNLNNVASPVILSYTGTGTGNLTITVGTGSWWGIIYYGGNWHIMDIPVLAPLVVMSGTGFMVFNNVNLGAKGDAIIVLGEGTDPLPVELSSFTAVLTQQYFVELHWTTQSESEAMGYYVFRNNVSSISNATNISPVMIQATNTTSEANYSYTDIDATPGTWYYWLQYNGIGGTNQLYGPISITVQDGTGSENTPVLNSLSGIGPNPFNPASSSLQANFGLSKAEDVSITIYNMKGEKVRKLFSGLRNAGTYPITWNGRDEVGKECTSGIYYMTMTTGTFSTTHKIVVVK